MCKEKCKGGKRCFKHCPEARAESRASGRLWDRVNDLKVHAIAFWDGAAKAASREEGEQFLSSWWASFVRKMLVPLRQARMDRAEKRAAAREVRQALDREASEQLRQSERERVEKGEKHWGQEAIERAERAAQDVEKATQEVEDLEEALLEAEEVLACTMPTDFALSPYQSLQFQCTLAHADFLDAEDAYYKAKAKQKPADMIPDPKTGLPSRKQQDLMRLKREMESARRMQDDCNARLEKTMTREQAEAARDAVVAELGAANARLEVLKEERHAARCAVRESSAVAEPEPVLAAA